MGRFRQGNVRLTECKEEKYEKDSRGLLSVTYSFMSLTFPPSFVDIIGIQHCILVSVRLQHHDLTYIY